MMGMYALTSLDGLYLSKTTEAMAAVAPPTGAPYFLGCRRFSFLFF